MLRSLIAAALMLLALCGSSFAQGLFQADAKISVVSTIVANNTTAVVVSTRPSALYQVDAYNAGAALAFIKVYDACATAVSSTCSVAATCGQATPAPKARYLIPFGSGSSGGEVITPNINGDAYAFGIVQCVTTGIADSDTGAPAASTFIVNIHFKPQTP